jgi:hypothetical protein
VRQVISLDWKEGDALGESRLSAPPAPAADHGRAIRAGNRLYRRFNRFMPVRTVRVRQARLMPPVVVDLGRLTGVIYRSDKWQRGRPRTFIHFMEDPPRLVCDPAGTQLYVVGGRYRVTARGIEG